MRNGLHPALPWIALLAVTGMLFARLGARRGDGDPRTPVPASPGAGPGADADRALAAEVERLRLALSQERDARTAAEAGAADALGALERAAAGRATADARVAALEAERTAAQEALQEARARTADLERRLEEARRSAGEGTDPVRALLAAARADAPREALAEGRRRAGTLSEAEVARLGALVEEEPALREAAVRVAGGLPEGDASARVLADLLRGEDAERAARERVDALAPRTLAPDAVARVLREAGPAVLAEVVPRLTGVAAGWGEADRERVAEALRELLARDDPLRQEAAARGIGLLRAGGAAPLLVSRLAAPEPAVRAAAAHALSRVPDLAAVRADATARLADLLADPVRLVRASGALLAEALLGAPVDFDPGAPEAARREAAARILERLAR